MLSEQIHDDVLALLASSGLQNGDAALSLCREGGNNRVFLVKTGGRQLIAKRYYRGPGDKRDRLQAEWSLLDYAQALELDMVPRPISRNESTGIALYEFVEGRKLKPGELEWSHIAAAAAFFRDLNGPRRQSAGAGLSSASEACFSLGDHLALIDARIARLGGIAAVSTLDREAIVLVSTLTKRWNAIKQRIAAEAAKRGEVVDEPLPPEQRCVSPSDFGFHNALLRPTGEVAFIDFEYAGWDDPAKMIADFFSQPAIPVPAAYFDRFLEEVAGFSAQAETIAWRTRLILPALRLKWCCIMLNDFLPDSARRRHFANPDADGEMQKRTQLTKAAKALHVLEG